MVAADFLPWEIIKVFIYASIYLFSYHICINSVVFAFFFLFFSFFGLFEHTFLFF